MNILIVSNGVPKPDNKMLGIFAYDQAKALASRGHNVCIASIDLRSFRHKRKYGFSKKTLVGGVIVYEYNFPLGAVPFNLYQLAAVKCLDYLYKRIIKDGITPDIVHAHFYKEIYCAAKLKNKYGYTLAATEHFSKFVDKTYTHRTEMLRRAAKAYNNVDMLFAVSESLANVIREECGNEVNVIPNIADVEVFTARSERQFHNGVRFISVGRLTCAKNYSLLIDSFAEAYKSRNDITLEIYGSGELKDNLLKQIKGRHAAENIKLCGFADRTVLAEAFSQADAFILLSDYETFGVAYIEAIAAGLPVIATKCGGPEDFVTKDNGISINCGDKVQAVAAILKMCDDYGKYNGSAMSEEIKQRFSPDTIAQELEKYYVILLERIL